MILLLRNDFDRLKFQLLGYKVHLGNSNDILTLQIKKNRKDLETF